MAEQYTLRLFGRDMSPAFEKAVWFWAALIFSYFFLLGFPRFFTLPATALILVGIYQSVRVIRHEGFWNVPAGYRSYCLIFLFLWLPLLFSLTDAKYAAEAAADTFKILGYGFCGIACVWLARDKRVVHAVVILLAGLSLFWTADVIFQRIIGFDVFGVDYVSFGEARAGAYFKNSAKFGTYLACMDVLAMYYIFPKLGHVRSIVALWIFFIVGMVFSMSRTGWLIFMIFSVPAIYFYVIRPVRYSWLWLMLGVLFSIPMIYFYYQHDTAMQLRMARTLAFMDGMTYENWNTVLTYRLDLWRAAWQMFSEHWLNGLGLHAFTTDFAGYPAAPFWHGVQPSHEHQYLLQVMVATGVLGLTGIIGVHAVIFWSWRKSGHGLHSVALPLALYLLAMWFPLSSHFSFYSSEWVWSNLMLLGLLAGALDAPELAEGHGQRT